MEGSAGVGQAPGEFALVVSLPGTHGSAQYSVTVAGAPAMLAAAQGRQLPAPPPPGGQAGGPAAGFGGLGEQIRAQTMEAVEATMRRSMQRAEAALQEARASGNAALIADREADLAALRTALEQIGQSTGQSTTAPPPQPPEPIPDVPAGAVIISLAVFAMVVLLVLGLPLVRAFGRRSELRQAPAAPDLEAREQLREIGHAVDAIAIEVERISARQRQIEGARVTDRSA